MLIIICISTAARSYSQITSDNMSPSDALSTHQLLFVVLEWPQPTSGLIILTLCTRLPSCSKSLLLCVEKRFTLAMNGHTELRISAATCALTLIHSGLLVIPGLIRIGSIICDTHVLSFIQMKLILQLLAAKPARCAFRAGLLHWNMPFSEDW